MLPYLFGSLAMAGGRPGGGFRRRGGAPPVPGNSRHHGRNGQTRLQPGGRSADQGRHPRNDHSVTSAGTGADCGLPGHLGYWRSKPGVLDLGRDAPGYHCDRPVRRHFDDVGRRRLGQRQEVHRGRPITVARDRTPIMRPLPVTPLVIPIRTPPARPSTR